MVRGHFIGGTMEQLEIILSLLGVVMAIEIPILLAVIPSVTRLNGCVATHTECLKYLDTRVTKLESEER